MRRSIVLLVLVLAVRFAVFAQTGENRTERAHSRMNGHGCSECHSCPKPSRKNLCLIECPRSPIPKTEGKKLSVKMCPEHISFDEIENLFEPVGFSHKSHAEMSEMNGGCTTCHHKTPTDQDHPSCKECHHPRTDIEDLEKPGLKAAYHRACKKCHAGWSEHAECEVCHNSKSEKEANTVGERESEPRSVVVPHKLIYEKRLQKGPYVTFFHQKHIKTHEIECEDCHGNQSCQACHYQTEKPSSHRIRTRAEKHIRCSDCHDTEERTECLNCHSKSY